jgi:hypothetical protein
MLPKHPKFGTSTPIDEACNLIQVEACLGFHESDLFGEELLINEVILLKSIILPPLEALKLVDFILFSLASLLLLGGHLPMIWLNYVLEVLYINHVGDHYIVVLQLEEAVVLGVLLD